MPNIWINAPNQTVQNAYESAGYVGNDSRITWTKDGTGIQQARFDVIQDGIQYRVEVVAQHLPGGGSVIKTQIFENGTWRLITSEEAATLNVLPEASATNTATEPGWADLEFSPLLEGVDASGVTWDSPGGVDPLSEGGYDLVQPEIEPFDDAFTTVDDGFAIPQDVSGSSPGEISLPGGDDLDENK
jgi:hypothetical protein